MSNSKWWTPHFKTKKLLEQKIRSIAAAAPIGAPLGDVDTQFMRWVFSHHDEFEDKCGVGFKGLIVKLDEFGNRFFSILRMDGSLIDISWRHALNPKNNERTIFVRALREEVKDQIFSFKKSSTPVCGICGNVIDGDIHVDHVVPFRCLVSDFFGADVHDVLDMGPAPSLLKDRWIAQEWIKYHKEKAILQMSHARCNLKKG